MANTGSGGFIPIDRMCVIPLSAAGSYYVAGGKYDGIFVIASTENAVDGIVNDLKDLFGNTVEIFSSKAILSVISNITGMLSVFLSAIASVSLIVAAVGIFAALYTTVLERTREIGVLKALGFSNGNVTMLFLGEAVLIGVIGGAMGDLAGVESHICLHLSHHKQEEEWRPISTEEWVEEAYHFNQSSPGDAYLRVGFQCNTQRFCWSLPCLEGIETGPSGSAEKRVTSGEA